MARKLNRNVYILLLLPQHRHNGWVESASNTYSIALVRVSKSYDEDTLGRWNQKCCHIAILKGVEQGAHIPCAKLRVRTTVRAGADI